nr:HTTM domain-containing protein [Haladaptatus litoreus]
MWSVFLPLGERWSVDSCRIDRPARRVVSFASAGLLVQVVIVYTANALFKLRGDMWMDGVAVQYIFSLQSYTTSFGDFLAQFPILLRLFDALWLALVISSVLLLLLTGWLRAAFASLFVAMHVGMLLTLHLSIFPLVSVVALVPFFPSVVWDAAERITDPLAESLDGYRWREKFERGALPTRTSPTIPATVSRWAGRIATLVAACLLVSVLVWNAATLGYVQTPEQVNDVADPAEHRWSMFAPEPWGVDGWYVVPGTLESGRQVDAFHDSDVRWGRPTDASLGYPTHRWYKYLLDVQYPQNERLRPHFTDYVCDRWNSNHEDGLTDISVYYVRQPTTLDGPEPTERVKLTTRSCP